MDGVRTGCGQLGPWPEIDISTTRTNDAPRVDVARPDPEPVPQAPRQVALPFLRPNPPKLTELTEQLARMERDRRFTNYGPNVLELEQLFDQHFGLSGSCVTANNATTGLMLAIRRAAELRPGRRFAIIPSFTFAATGEAVLWAGLEPLFCDVGSQDWLPSLEHIEALLAAHGQDVAVIVPYATFGSHLDVAAYAELERRFDVPTVIDAAASLGTLDRDGQPAFRQSPYPVVFSMHATKTFAVGEAGLVHCADPAIIAEIRSRTNFGFNRDRSARTLGLNGKLSEVLGIIGVAQFRCFADVTVKRSRLAERYRENLPDWRFQSFSGDRQAYAFMPVLLPDDIATMRVELLSALEAELIECGRYFSPHLAEQPLFEPYRGASSVPVTDEIAARIVALPLWEEMVMSDVDRVCAAAERARARLRERS